MFSKLFGPNADAFFQGMGASPIQVRYRGVVITPTPLVSHEGVQGTNESSRLVQSESFSTVTVSIPKQVLIDNLARGVPAGPNFTLESAIAPNKPWELNFDGRSWQQYRSLGDPDFEVFRVKLTLVAAR